MKAPEQKINTRTLHADRAVDACWVGLHCPPAVTIASSRPQHEVASALITRTSVPLQRLLLQQLLDSSTRGCAQVKGEHVSEQRQLFQSQGGGHGP